LTYVSIPYNGSSYALRLRWYVLCLQFLQTLWLVLELHEWRLGTPMTILEALTKLDAQRVEVSGWDANEIFFVEKSEMGWTDFAEKHICLRRMLADDSIVFLRFSQAEGLGQSPTSVYRVEFLGSNGEGGNEFRLHAVQPRYSQGGESIN
jgi:hypothetical protein